jgi:multidrug efflux pump subunit AcrA (membrane-fusion protein)
MPDLDTTLPVRRADLILRPTGGPGQYVVKDPRTSEYFRLGKEESFLLLGLDGRQTPGELRGAFEREFGEPLPEGDLNDFLDMARSHNFLQPAAPGRRADSAPPAPLHYSDGAATPLAYTPARPAEPAPAPAPAPARAPAPAAAEEPAPRRRRARGNLLYWRARLFDPDRAFARVVPHIGFLWARGFLAVSGVWIAMAALVAWANRLELVSTLGSSLSWETAALVWLTLAAATFCHEFAHGLTCRHYGGEVREIGFLLMFFMPCFYCNVSDAWLFPKKSRRLWVTLAGGYCDLCVWGLAVFVWRLTPPGTLTNHVAFVMLSVLGARVFLNFNPLLKLDGYYLLSDALEIPNLQQKAWAHVAARMHWLLWGAGRPAPEHRGGLLLLYGLLSYLFSLVFVTLMLAAMWAVLVPRFGLLGVAAVLALATYTARRVLSVWKSDQFVTMLLKRHRRRAIWAGVLAAVAATLVFGTMEDRAGGPFQLRPVTRAEVRAPVAGFLREILFDEGDRVAAGALVARIEVPDLDSRTAQKRAEVREAQAKLRLLEAGPRPEEVLEQRHKVERAGGWHELARQDLAKAEVGLREDLARLDAQMAQYRTEKERAHDLLDRSRQLRDQRALADEQFLDAQKLFQVSGLQEQQALAQRRAREAAGSREAEAEVAKRKKELADAQATLTLLEAGSRPEDIEAERARLARLNEELHYLDGLRAKVLVVSPVAGLVATPHLKERIGQFVHEGDLIGLVEEPGELEAEIALTEQEVARIEPGWSVELKARALPFETFTSEVARVAPATARPDPLTAATSAATVASRTELPAGTVSVYCRVTGVTADLRPGMTGYARVSRGKRAVGTVLGERALRFLRTEFWW